MSKPIGELLSALGIQTANPGLYEMALTHSSVNGDLGSHHRDYERLEFLGDAVIGLVTSDLAFRYHPEMQQGDLTVLRSQAIRTESEAEAALELKLDEYLIHGVSFQEAGRNRSVLEDVYEAFVGAVYLDQGLETAWKIIEGYMIKRIILSDPAWESNPKSELQEAIQADYKDSVTYKVLKDEKEGNEHLYTVGVFFQGIELGRGQGKNKKEAETRAASDALSKRAGLE